MSRRRRHSRPRTIRRRFQPGFEVLETRLAPAVVLSQFIYTELVLVIALGYLVFGDVPQRWTLAGSAIVVASGLYLLHREHRRSRPAPG